MYSEKETINCPYCGQSFFSAFYSSDDLRAQKHIKNIKLLSDYDWLVKVNTKFNLCPTCENVFNTKIREKGLSIEFERNNENAKKNVIGDGIEFYDKAFNLVPIDEVERLQILLGYIWEFEQLDNAGKIKYSKKYDAVVLELIRFLELESFKYYSSPVFYGNDVLINWITLPTNDNNSEAKTAYFQSELSESQAGMLLALAEFYRRRELFDKSIAILGKYYEKIPESYQKLADGIVLNCKVHQE